MENNMLKKFLDGLVFGAGFSITFVTIWFIAYYFVLPGILESRFNSITEEKVSSIIHEDNKSVLKSAPPIIESNRFLGSMGIYSGDFLDNKSGVLAKGPGKIIGKVTTNGVPATGLRLRLALNGSVMSQWATSDESGQYIVPVPYGEYKIDGFELNHASANRTLRGMIGHPQMEHTSQKFSVTNDSPGYGLDFKFISPVEKIIPRNRFSSSEDVVIKWKAYPGATQYRIQIHEKTDPRGYNMPEQLFEWQHLPVVSDTSIDLSDFYDAELKAGHFYKIEIDALDDNMNLLSTTARNYSGYDFEIIKEK
jgi:hypothetical protein